MLSVLLSWQCKTRSLAIDKGSNKKRIYLQIQRLSLLVGLLCLLLAVSGWILHVLAIVLSHMAALSETVPKMPQACDEMGQVKYLFISPCLPLWSQNKLFSQVCVRTDVYDEVDSQSLPWDYDSSNADGKPCLLELVRSTQSLEACVCYERLRTTKFQAAR